MTKWLFITIKSILDSIGIIILWRGIIHYMQLQTQCSSFNMNYKPVLLYLVIGLMLLSFTAYLDKRIKVNKNQKIS